jgi:hypothetical protein
MPTQKPETKVARQVKAGDIVTMKGSKRTEVVRNVTVVLHLANGVDEVHEATDKISVHPPEVVDE